MRCACCLAPGIDDGHHSPPYLCLECEYISDDVGEFFCEECQITMEQTAAWHHTFREGPHTIIKQ